jgi:hypothetical protein
MTFEDVELRVVQDLKQRIVSGAGANMDVVHAADCPPPRRPLGQPPAGERQRADPGVGGVLRRAEAGADFFTPERRRHAAASASPTLAQPLRYTVTSCSL